MKKGYQKLLILELAILVLLVINSFISNFLTGYKTVFFLFIVLGVFRWLLGFEKDRHRYIKDFILNETLIIIVFLLAYYALGLFVGFLKTDFFSFESLRKIVLPSILYIVLREFLRYLALSKSEGNSFLTIFSIIIIIFLDISSNIYHTDFSSKYGTFIFIATILLPTIFSNIAFSFITKKVGYKPVLFYCLIMELYDFVLPIVPDSSVYINTIIDIVLPSILCYTASNIFEKIQNAKVDTKTIKKKKPYLALSLAGITVMIIVYFTSGLFNHWAIVIASNSMANSILKGDVVVIDKVNSHYEKIKEGNIIAYEYNDKIIVHRVVEVKKTNDKYYFKTKGDANINIDDVLITEDMVVGVVNVKIPYIGLPTVWLKNL